MTTDGGVFSNPTRHLKTLGICWVLYGAVSLGSAVWLTLINTTATLMFGALLDRVPDPFSMMNSFHFWYAFLIVMSGVIGMLGILAGAALLTGARSARSLTMLASFFSLSIIPLGTTLGIYSLIAFLNWVPQQTSAAAHGVSIPDLKRHAMTS
jgi:hypothetical protein